MKFLKKIFGDPNKKILTQLQKRVIEINTLESQTRELSDTALAGKTAEFKERLVKGETLDQLLPEVFAVVREASYRVLGLRHFDVQLIGGMVLHGGDIAEMRTGEGKTLVATLPTYLNALEGKGVHVVTVNDYLARRDAVWMGGIYAFLGLSVGVVQQQHVSYRYTQEAQSVSTSAPVLDSVDNEDGAPAEDTQSFHVEYEHLLSCTRKDAYACDITYGTNNEFGFDYLRDNMVQSMDAMVMRHGNGMHYAIIDEVDSILIDEARTPLIISAPAEKATDQYYQYAKWVKQLARGTHYTVDEKMRAVALTDAGIKQFEQWLGVENIYVEGGILMVHHIEEALKAEVLYHVDKEYIVEGGKVIIIDEFTGRKMPGRRFSGGLHQALEAKEGLAIQRESRTLATITFQNLFRMYGKLSGMTGTAETESEELYRIYGLSVVVVPTNHKNARTDYPDRIYKTEKAKYAAIAAKIGECREKGQPVLIGTISVEKNEALSTYLRERGIAHEILNAKNHEREGEIIAQAGRPGAVTLATNMAGRGVDIKLGGNPTNESEAARARAGGGLFVLGTERHESRRIDNQLRGRSARQGDPGETQFFVSTEDDLMRIFAGDRMRAVMERFNMPDDMPIEERVISRLLESAQQKVEGQHFDVRKHLLEYDDILNKHRSAIYRKRREVLSTGIEEDTLDTLVLGMMRQEIEFVVSYHTNTDGLSHAGSVSAVWDGEKIAELVGAFVPLSVGDISRIKELCAQKNSADKLDDVHAREALVSFLHSRAQEVHTTLAAIFAAALPGSSDGAAMVRDMERALLLRAYDVWWVEHLMNIDSLRTGIGLRSYGQRDPLIEYKKESFYLFQELQNNIQREVVMSLFKTHGQAQIAQSPIAQAELTLTGGENGEDDASFHTTSSSEKVGRNDPCPCGSGKKYKKCHGA
jgi:preprotein translocase subunit SecA